MEAAAAFKHPRLRLGALLLRNGLLSAEQLAEALEQREQTGIRIGEIVVQRGWVSDEDLARTLAEQFEIDFVDVEAVAANPALDQLLPVEVARSVHAVPVEISHGAAVIAVADPTGEALEVLSAELDLPVVLAVAPATAIERAIDRIDTSGAEPVDAPPEPDTAPPAAAPLAGEPEAYSAIEWFDNPAPAPTPEAAADEPATETGDAGAPANVAPFELRRPLLGTLLLRDGLISAGQLAEALVEKEETEERLGEILLRNGWITEVALSRLLAEQFAVVYVDLAATPPDDRAKRLLSGALARYFWAVPVRFVDNDTVLVAIADPTAFGVDDIERAIGFRVVLGLATESAVAAAVERLESEEDTMRPHALGDEKPAEPEPVAVQSDPGLETPDVAPAQGSSEDPAEDALFPTLHIVETVDAVEPAQAEEPELPAWIGPSIADEQTPPADTAEAGSTALDDPPPPAATPWDDWAVSDESPDAPEPAPSEIVPEPPPWSWLDAVLPPTEARTDKPEPMAAEDPEPIAVEESEPEAIENPETVDEPETLTFEEPQSLAFDEPEPVAFQAPEPITVEVPEPEATENPETVDEPETVIFEEPQAVAFDEPQPVAFQEPEPFVSEPEPAVVDEPAPVAFEEPEPAAMDEPEPMAFEEPEPVAVQEPEPIVFPEPEPTPIEEPQPVDAPEPPVFDAPEPPVVEAPEPPVVEELQPVAFHEPEPVAFDEPEPVSTEDDEPQTDEELVAAAFGEFELDEPAPEADTNPKADELVDGLLRLAVEEGASDLHFEPQAERLAVRARVDGVMQELYSAPALQAKALLDRLELIGGLDVGARRPQEEQVTFTLDSEEIDARVTIAPTAYGSRVALRFSRAARELTLDQLGLAPDAAAQVERAISRPYGAVIVAGPREGGTTTTLYAMLRELDASSRCLMTIEDPIAVPLPGVAQIQVDRAAGLGFAEGLRTILASDPDAVLVGDLADPETAWTSIDAGVTGQLVLAAMKAEDIGGAISRLTDMGVSRQLLAAATNCFVAQRLARKLCADCRESYDLDVEELLEAGARESDLPVGGSVTLYRSVGCDACAGGYRGRVAMFEALLVTPETRRLLETGTAEELYQAAVAAGMRTLQEDGLRLCLLGQTSLEEVKRVAGEPR